MQGKPIGAEDAKLRALICALAQCRPPSATRVSKTLHDGLLELVVTLAKQADKEIPQVWGEDALIYNGIPRHHPHGFRISVNVWPGGETSVYLVPIEASYGPMPANDEAGFFSRD